MDDYADDTFDLSAPRGVINVGGSATGSIEASWDTDLFAVSLVAGRTYRFDLRGSQSGGGTLADPSLRLLNSSGSPLAYNDDASLSTRDSSITFTPTTTGNYFLEAMGYSTNAGSYTLVSVAPDDFADTLSDQTLPRGVLGIGLTRAGSIETSGDTDIFSVSLVAGQTYTFDLRGSPSGGGTLSDPSLRLLNASGVQLAANDDLSSTLRDSRITFTASTSGTYFLEARAYSTFTGTYTLAALAGLPDDFADSLSDTTVARGALSIGVARTGSIEGSGDTDIFTVTLVGGQTYTFDLRGSPSGGGTLSDPSLRLLNASGSQLASNDDLSSTVRDSRITFTASTSGTYFLEARAYSTFTGTYTLAAIAGLPDDYADNLTDQTAPRGALSLGVARTASIETSGDTDTFSVSLLAGQTYTFDLRGSPSGGGTLSDPSLRLLNGSGSQLAANDDLSSTLRDSRITFTASASGTYFLEARGYSTSTGTYTIAATAGLPDDYADSLSDATVARGSLTVGGSRAGSVETNGDKDIFAVSLVAGQSYIFELRGAPTGGGTLGDAYLRLLNGSGAQLAYNDDTSTQDSRIAFTATTSGAYFLEAGGYASYTGTYTISASVATTDDFAVNYADITAPRGTLSVGGTRTGVIESGGDTDLFSMVLTAGQSYTIRQIGGTNADPYIRGVYNSAGVLLANTSNDDFGGTTNALVTFTPTATGTYFVQAGAFGSNAGSYTMSLVAGSASVDIAASTATTAALAVGDRQVSRVESAGDVDWFRVTLTAGQNYTFTQEGSTTSSSRLVDPYIRGIYNASGVLIPGTSNDDYAGSSNARVSFTAAQSGTYYVAAGAYGSYTGEYVLGLTSTTVVDAIAASTATTGVISVNGNRTGSVDYSRDVDWYRVDLAAGQQYTINLRGQATGDGTLADPEFFGVYNSAGVLIPGTGNDDFGGLMNSQVTFTPSATGTYYLAAGGHYEHVGTYNLAIATSTSADIAANASTTASIAVGGTFQSSIETARDVDWIRVNLTGGQTYQVSLQGYGTSGNLADPLITGVYAANGNAIPGSSNDDFGGGRNAQATFVAPSTGAYYIGASAYSSFTGNYIASIRTATTADTVAPRLLATTPADDSTGVSVSSNLTLTFDEAVRAGSGDLLITGSNGWTNTISVTNTNAVSFNGEVMTVNPSMDLAPGVNYTVTMQAGAVRDLAGNAHAGITSSSAFNFSTATVGTPIDAWTIMVYIAGDNNLEQFALSDLNEMESVNLPANVNVVFLMDRSPGYSTAAGDWTNTRVGAVTYDGSNAAISSTMTSWGEMNTGAGATLTQFINWSATNYRAQNYGLVVWNHGGGLAGVAWDDTSNDNLGLGEMRQAINNSSVSRFGVMGFDACLQGMVEQAFDMRSIADVLVSSQELEPGDGWAYDRFLTSLAANPGMTASDLGANIVASYGQEYAGQSGITLSATRVSAMTALDTALDSFVTVAKTIPGSSSDWAAMQTAAQRATSFSGNMRDLGDFMDEVAARVSNSSLRTAAINVGTALDTAVIANAGTVTDANGLSIYLPYGSDTVRSDYTAANYSFLSAVAWNEFLTLI